MIAHDQQEQPVEGHDAQASGAARTALRLRAYARLAAALADELEAAATGDAARRTAAAEERGAAEAALRDASAEDGEAGADGAMREALDALEQEAARRAQEELLAGLGARARARAVGLDPRVPAWGDYLPAAPVAGQLDVRR